MGSKRATGGKHSCIERIQRRSKEGGGNPAANRSEGKDKEPREAMDQGPKISTDRMNMGGHTTEGASRPEPTSGPATSN